MLYDSLNTNFLNIFAGDVFMFDITDRILASIEHIRQDIQNGFSKLIFSPHR